MEARAGIEPAHKGFADLSLTTWVPRLGLVATLCGSVQPAQPYAASAGRDGAEWSGRRDLNSRPSPWQGDALPLSYSRLSSLWSRSASSAAHPNRKLKLLCTRKPALHRPYTALTQIRVYRAQETGSNRQKARPPPGFASPCPGSGRPALSWQMAFPHGRSRSTGRGLLPASAPGRAAPRAHRSGPAGSAPPAGGNPA
jgi:hypothetical protein